MERFLELTAEVKAFLSLSKNKAAAEHLALLRDAHFMSTVAFLSDIFGHLNDLNLKLQGREKLIVDIVEKLESFMSKIEAFQTDMSTGRDKR